MSTYLLGQVLLWTVGVWLGCALLQWGLAWTDRRRRSPYVPYDAPVPPRRPATPPSAGPPAGA